MAKLFFFRKFQNHLVFIPAKKYINFFCETTRIDSWKSSGISEENIENITKSDSNFAPTSVDHRVLPDINFNGHCLIMFPSLKKVVNLYIPYIINALLRNLNTDLTLKNCLFGSVKLTKNSDPDKYKYSGYNTGFDSRSGFYIQMQAWEKNVLIFRADTKSSAHIDNKN